MKPFYADKSKENSPTQFSLYTTEKPKCDISYIECLKDVYKWSEQSHFAYLQEPEFTEINYWKVKELYVAKQFDLRGHTFIIGDTLKTGSYFFQTLSKLLKEGNLSHFYPGQKIDPSKVSYVREVTTTVALKEHKSSALQIYKQWQPAPEPLKNDGFKEYSQEHAQWTADRSEGKVLAIIN